MKNLIFILIAGAIFWGCSGEPRHSVLGLPSYQAAGNYKTKKSVYIASVEDKRKNKAVSATITDKKGTVSEYITRSLASSKRAARPSRVLLISASRSK